jgi:hypothetical protein
VGAPADARVSSTNATSQRRRFFPEVVREQLDPFLVRSRNRGMPVARFVERELRAYLECGVLAHGFLRVFQGALFADQRRRVRRFVGVRCGQVRSVTFIQRFGSALNLTPHFHTLVLDGVYP